MDEDRDLAFAERLRKACEMSKNPDLQAEIGRQAAVARFMDVSEQSASRWFNGRARPRGEAAVNKLAKFLGVSAEWLFFGKEVEEMDRAQVRARLKSTEGAVLYVRGLLTLAGAACADPEPDDPSGRHVDFYAILNNRAMGVRVALAQEEKGAFVFAVPSQFRDLRLFGVVVMSGRTDVLDLERAAVDDFKVRVGGDFAIRATPAPGGNYTTRTHTWRKIRRVEDLTV